MHNRFLLIIIVVFSILSGSAQTPAFLQITSPADRSIFFPGQTITISITADPSVSEIAIVGQNPLSFSQPTTVPLQFSLNIPSETVVDQYQINAVGSIANGEDVVSSPITVFVESPLAFTKIETEPTVLRFRASREVMPLRVVATAVVDNTQIDISHSIHTSYSSTDPNVVTVDSRGLVTAVGPGSAFIDVASSGRSVSVSAKVTQPPVDIIPPTTTAIASPQSNAAGWNNSDITVQLASIDNEGGSGVQSITITTSGAQNSQTTTLGNTANLTITSEGTTTISYFGTDNAGNAEPAKTLVLKLDKTAPAVTGLPSQCSLWPPNGKLVTVATLSSSDSLSGLVSFDVSATSNESTNPIDPDIIISGSGAAGRVVQLRASRLGTGPGRTYQIVSRARDIAGNITLKVAVCIVPHDQGLP